jgi:hypothetical protein
VLTSFALKGFLSPLSLPFPCVKASRWLAALGLDTGTLTGSSVVLGVERVLAPPSARGDERQGRLWVNLDASIAGNSFGNSAMSGITSGGSRTLRFRESGVFVALRFASGSMRRRIPLGRKCEAALLGL